MAENAVAGVIHVRVGDDIVSVRGTLNVSLSDRERETIVGADGVHGFKEMPRAPFIEVEITDTQKTDLTKLEGLTDTTVEVDLKNGKSGVLSNAWQINAVEVNGIESTATLRFEGRKGEWLSNG